MPKPKKNNESMQNAAERLIADIANNPSVYMEGDSMDKLKFLLDGMSRGRVMSDGSQRASDKVSTIIKEYGAPSYHREVGMTPRTVGSINRGQVAQVDPDLGVTMDYPYMAQERQRLEDVKADEMNAILADLVRNPPRRTAGTSYKTGGKVKYRSGGMMKYPGGGMMPRKRGMMKYENGGEVDPDSPEFKEYLEYRMRGSGQPLYFDEYKGEQLSPTELRQMIREQGSSMAIPRSLMPESVSDRYMNEAMIGYSSGPGGARATMSDAMSGAEAKFNQNRKFEQEFLEYMKGKGGAATKSQVCVWSRLQRANLPTPKEDYWLHSIGDTNDIK